MTYFVPEQGQVLAVGLAQHPDEHRPQRPVLLAVDQEFGKGRGLRPVLIT
jgi:hypothetical protein